MWNSAAEPVGVAVPEPPMRKGLDQLVALTIQLTRGKPLFLVLPEPSRRALLRRKPEKRRSR
jgi:hypothetical protein